MHAICLWGIYHGLLLLASRGRSSMVGRRSNAWPSCEQLTRAVIAASRRMTGMTACIAIRNKNWII